MQTAGLRKIEGKTRNGPIKPDPYCPDRKKDAIRVSRDEPVFRKAQIVLFDLKFFL